MAISHTLHVADVFEYYLFDEPNYLESNSSLGSFEVRGTDVEQITQAFVE